MHNTFFKTYICIGYYYIIHIIKSIINQKIIIMKKKIVYLGIALIATANVLLASNVKSFSNVNNKVETVMTVTPLGTAVFKGDLITVKKFVEYGADVNEKSNGMSLLMIAARYNKVEIIKFLLSKGAHLNDKDENGYTALKHAELSNATEAIELLKQQ